MENIIEKVRIAKNLSEIDGIEDVELREVLLAVAESRRADLLTNPNSRFYINKPEVFELLLRCFKEENERYRPFGVRRVEMPIVQDENFVNMLLQFADPKLFTDKLLSSETFRNECISRGRIDIAVMCTLPKDFAENEQLKMAYCKQLQISPEALEMRLAKIAEYHKKNADIYNTLLGASLKDGIFGIKEEHLERFVNDINIQKELALLGVKELDVLSRILEEYDFKDFDISVMISNIIKNMGDYKNLIKSLNVNKLTEKSIKELVKVLQNPNSYGVSNEQDVHNFDKIKTDAFVRNFGSRNINVDKSNLLMVLFNIDLNEAKYIDYKYSHDNKNNCTLDELENSELPPQIYGYLRTIHEIINCEDPNELIKNYESLKDKKVYECEVPLETFLRSKYTEMYSRTLFVADKNGEYNNETTFSEVEYSGRKVQLCIPRSNFNALVHCLGGENQRSETNFSDDWLKRPQIRHHFIACSLFCERELYSVIRNNVIYGFAPLEGGAILAMGNTDIDSIGNYDHSYCGSRELQEENRDRAKFYVPSQMIKSSLQGYNEIIIERRNGDRSKNPEFKRKPSYIMMMVDSIDANHLRRLDCVLGDLDFVSEEDKKAIKAVQVGKRYTIQDILIKYKDEITKKAQEKDVDEKKLAAAYVSSIMDAKLFEACVRAASDFNIPLVIIDRQHYLKKSLEEAGIYDIKTINWVVDRFGQVDEMEKKKIFRTAAKMGDFSKLFDENAQNEKNGNQVNRRL